MDVVWRGVWDSLNEWRGWIVTLKGFMLPCGCLSVLMKRKLNDALKDEALLPW